VLTQVQQRQQDRNEELAMEISACQERQRAMEAENEQLKQVLTSLARRLALLGPAFGGASAPPPGCTASPINSTATAATTATGGGAGGGGSSLPSPSPAAADLFTPVHTAAPSGCEGPFGLLPEVPAFPFPAQAPAQLQQTLQTPGALLRLAEALGAQSPQPPATQPTQLSLASSLPSLPCTPSVEDPQPPGHIFSFTLRKADETDLGLNVSQLQKEQVLCVEGIRPEGAVDAWNRQCLGGSFPERAVMVGDKILSVNNVQFDPEKMLEECKEKLLLRLTICRGEIPASAAAPAAVSSVGLGLAPTPDAAVAPEAAATALSPVRLRAEASEFVPMAAAGVTSPADAAAGGAP
jgi:hypothetical protein